ncbi:MAG: glucose-6-phosphate isomerase [Lentisphaeria bacterium]|nr:glucose-6-phosphate isomerase [Lentisphaeria bacterium]
MSKTLNTSPMTGFVDPETHFCLDLSGMRLDPERLLCLTRVQEWSKVPPPPSPCARAHEEMTRIEKGAIKNPDEGRRVTHFSDRRSYCARALFGRVQRFAERVRSGAFRPEGQRIEAVIVNGIGGSALGPQLLHLALRGPYWNEWSCKRRDEYPRLYFLDNTDSAGLDDVLAVVDPRSTLVVTISKSGTTKETRNNMVALEKAYAAAGVAFRSRAVAVTMANAESALYRYARAQRWARIFPMARSIGGRTSETNIVGHVPAALAGIDFGDFVRGAAHMDELTRNPDPLANPAYQLALAWYIAGDGRGDRNMVIVPYSDRLVLLAKYLQQLVMESLGKERALDGRIVNQGLSVFGNKGGTDAHAYIQQLNDGRDDFFVTFVAILEEARAADVDRGLTMGDFLHAFRLGLSDALTGKGRQVITLRLDRLSPFSLGMIIALYERAVAYYAELIGVNAFHQPGVQAYKRASDAITALNLALQEWIARARSTPWEGTAAEAAAAVGCPELAAAAADILAVFSVNGRTFGGSGVRRMWRNGWVFRVG